MLAYLEDLCGALIAHDTDAIQRLLAHPLARSLPRQVREEAIAISRATAASLRAPIQTLRFYHQTLQLGAPGREMSAGEPAEENSLDTDTDTDTDTEPDRGPSHVVPSADPYGRDVRETQGRETQGRETQGRETQGRETRGREVPRQVTGREQIDLPLEPPRKAQAA
jgi:hypothetical protein